MTTPNAPKDKTDYEAVLLLLNDIQRETEFAMMSTIEFITELYTENTALRKEVEELRQTISRQLAIIRIYRKL